MIGIMRNYTQLTEEQRYQIYEGITLGLTQAEIVEELAVNRSTISRELKRSPTTMEKSSQVMWILQRRVILRLTSPTHIALGEGA